MQENGSRLYHRAGLGMFATTGMANSPAESL